jgi:glycine/D-amino acid oxidase-like deaminating enzyme
MRQQDSVAVIGAGIVGSAVALGLTREGRRVLLLDRAAPGVAGASFGNVGHIAAELVQPLPSPALLLGFWRLLTRFGGPLDLPARQVLRMLPWIARFARAAFQRDVHTRALAPLVLPAAAAWERWLQEIGRPELLRRNGHYEIGFGAKSAALFREQARVMARFGIKTEDISQEQLEPVRRAARADSAAGLWFEDSAHVVDPLGVVQAFAQSALERGAELRRVDVRALQVRGEGIAILNEGPAIHADAVVVCAGMGSASLLANLGLHAPLQSVRGYHIELPGEPALIDAPVVYTDEHLLVTPMAGRLRASTYMEFADEQAPPDPSKPDNLRRKVRAMGYRGEPKESSWVGARPILPDYLPGIGRAPGPAKVFYAVGHQHIGLTLAPVTGDLIADLVAERAARLPIDAFDLRRFGGAHQ